MSEGGLDASLLQKPLQYSKNNYELEKRPDKGRCNSGIHQSHAVIKGLPNLGPNYACASRKSMMPLYAVANCAFNASRSRD